MPSPNNDAPHQAIILIKAEVFERLPTGECHGRPRTTEQTLASITATNYEECLNKLKEFFKQVKNINEN